MEADGETGGMVESASRRGGEEPDYITKAVQLSTEQQYEYEHFTPLTPSQMSITQLASLIQRMNDVKAKLEVRFLFSLRSSFFALRSSHS